MTDRLGLPALLAAALPDGDARVKVSAAAAIRLVVSNLILGREPLYGLGEWAARYDPALLGLSASEVSPLNDDRVGRALETLFDADRASLLTGVVLRAISEFHVDTDPLHNAGQFGDSDRGTGLVLLLLGVVAGVLVLGGVLTSTLLALSDARPQFATLHAIGAADRSRRSVAAGYAATIAVLGALLGLGAGLVTGVAVAYPLTTDCLPLDGLLPPFLDVPRLLLTALLVAVPAVAALVASLSARGPLPGIARKALA